MRQIKVSAKMARLRFNGCDPEYIRTTCHARCCESSTSPTGTIITIHPTEQQRIEQLGGVVTAGLLQPAAGCRKCPFKQTDHLCGLHVSGQKPFGCVASPFTLNANDTLIVRNRYRLLKCYNDGRRIEAYVAFRASLDLIFGPAEAQRVCLHLERGGGDVMATVSEENYLMIKQNDEIKHKAKKPDARCFGQDLMKGEHKMKSTFNDRQWTKEKGIKGLAQDAHVKKNRLLLPPSSDTDFYIKKRKKEKELGRNLTTDEFYAMYEPEGAENVGTSIFDPVLCELVYRWFSPPSGRVLDPFAGGSVRGVVASVLGRQYTGIDLSARQIKANEAQAKQLCTDPMPRWIVGDSRCLGSLIDHKQDCHSMDLVFSCPPYFDLEVYSEDEHDLSTMQWKPFVEAYRQIIASACDTLKPDRFACFVVGDVRDKQGFYRDFPGETIRAFQAAGLLLYNDAILVTSVGSLPIRVGRQFESYRKLGTTHQRVLVFFKGDPKSIKEWPAPEFSKDLLPSTDDGQ
jgi:DNA modification methylase